MAYIKISDLHVSDKNDIVTLSDNELDIQGGCEFIKEVFGFPVKVVDTIIAYGYSLGKVIK